MSRLEVDNQVIEIEDGCIIYCSPAEGMDTEGQAFYWSWSQASPELKKAFLKLRKQWSKMMTKFMEDNRDALDALKSQEEGLVLKDVLPIANPHAVEIVESDVESISKEPILIFTDGSCQPNPGRGGWGAIIRVAGCEPREMSGGAKSSTNNQMELTSAIKALQSLPVPSTVILTTDSQYMKNGITQWINNWKRNGWRTAAKKPVLNADLWRELDALNQQHNVSWQWVRGHNGHPENERCDQLANEAILKF